MTAQTFLKKLDYKAIAEHLLIIGVTADNLKNILSEDLENMEGLEFEKANFDPYTDPTGQALDHYR